jgi:hypothetical protein
VQATRVDSVDDLHDRFDGKEEMIDLKGEDLSEVEALAGQFTLEDTRRACTLVF